MDAAQKDRLIHAALITRFWRKVKRGESRACWLYLGRDGGHGTTFWLGEGVSVPVHVFAYRLRHGVWPVTCSHLCGKPRCCNPLHLFDMTLVTGGVWRAERSGVGVLSPDAVREIRSLQGVETAYRVGMRFKVDASSIVHIWEGQTYKWVT